MGHIPIYWFFNMMKPIQVLMLGRLEKLASIKQQLLNAV